ncbi:hypothetical protein KIPB_009724 [Kipferlia bialata]|uniref:MIB/HERC2 domain-containing protein n=1 Tax=Kipferlia bialata TaxID=797122 RepID=A0A9K3GMH1_9EUKA|nr:hypothetical protein KIPB_009724 [Kipferlia bialata]|eukprot:g9724.t1
MSWFPNEEERAKLGAPIWIGLAPQNNENGDGVLVGSDLKIGAKVRRGNDADKDSQPDGVSEGELVGISESEPTLVLVKWDNDGTTHTYRAKPGCAQLEYV